MSKKKKGFSIEQYGKLFKEFTDDADLRKQNVELYNMIYNYYKHRIHDINFDINIERITLNKLAGKHRGYLANFDLQIAVMVITILLSSIIQLISASLQMQGGGIAAYLISIGLVLYFIHDLNKQKSPYKEFIYTISHQVLDDLEKELLLQRNKKVILKIPKKVEDKNKTTTHQIKL